MSINNENYNQYKEKSKDKPNISINKNIELSLLETLENKELSQELEKLNNKLKAIITKYYNILKADKLQLSRRQFLKLAAGTIISSLLIPSSTFASNNKQQINNKNKKENNINLSLLDKISYEIGRELEKFFEKVLKMNFKDKSFSQTSIDTLKELIFISLLYTFLKKIGYNSGLPKNYVEKINNDIKNNFRKAILDASITAPLLEEIIFRRLPSKLF